MPSARTLFLIVALIAAGAASAYFAIADLSVPPAPTIVLASARPVVAEVEGHIENIYVGEGAIVRLGDPLIQLDTRQFIRRKKALETRIHLAEVRGSNVSSLAPLYAQLLRAQLDIDRCTITSPTDGVIISITSAGRGHLLQPGALAAIIYIVPLAKGDGASAASAGGPKKTLEVFTSSVF